MQIEELPLKCALCGVTLDVSDGVRPVVHIEGASGKPNERVLTVDGREVHRCTVVPPLTP